jgi:hypothetical protein
LAFGLLGSEVLEKRIEWDIGWGHFVEVDQWRVWFLGFCAGGWMEGYGFGYRGIWGRWWMRESQEILVIAVEVGSGWAAILILDLVSR